jgi:GNAT superfamily N-acetyltransferase
MIVKFIDMENESVRARYFEPVKQCLFNLSDEMNKLKQQLYHSPGKINENYFLNNDVWVAEENGQVAGIAVGTINEFMYDLKFLYVCPEYRNNGLGTKFLEKASQRAKSLDCDYFIIKCKSHNYSAIKLYLKTGYNVEALILAKNLKEEQHVN